MREIKGHERILKNILFEKGLDAKDLARLINYSETNYPKAFNKETYTQKMIEKISTALGIEPTVFTIQAVGGDNHGVVMQTVSLEDRVAELEGRLRDKEEIIDYLRKRIVELEQRLDELVSRN